MTIIYFQLHELDFLLNLLGSDIAFVIDYVGIPNKSQLHTV